MEAKKKQRARTLSREHWEWLGKYIREYDAALIDALSSMVGVMENILKDRRNVMEMLYKDAIEHGVKHGVTDKEFTQRTIGQIKKAIFKEQ